MANSGTFSFNPTIGSLAMAAFSRCQIKRAEIGAEHMENVFLETNLMQADWSADGITFWNVVLNQQALTAGVQTYTVPTNAITVLDVYVNNGSSNRLLFPFSRTDFASLAEPSEQGFPTSFWHDRLLVQTLSLWPVPDNAANYTMYFYTYNQPQDAVIMNGGNAAIPFFWLDAFVAGLAYRLARHHAPALEAARKVDATVAYANASKQVENAPMYITPGLSGFYRS